MASVYKITNLVNGKIYIGQTINSVDSRFKQHLYQATRENKGSAIYAAISKYGKDNFVVESLVSGDYSKVELNELEAFYIKKYESLYPKGYNLQTGGCSFLVAESLKKRISTTLKGREIAWAKKVSEGLKKVWQDKEYREKQVLQRREKRGKYREGIKKPLRLNLPLEEINKMYSNGKSIYAIAKYYKVPYSTIKRRINYGD